MPIFLVIVVSLFYLIIIIIFFSFGGGGLFCFVFVVAVMTQHSTSLGLYEQANKIGHISKQFP